MNFAKSKLTSLFLIIVIALIYQACAVNPVTGKKELMLMSEGQELALGAQYDPGIIANFGLYQDDVLQRFINDKGKEMGAISHRPHLDYKFRILDSPVINAFAVPGGYIYFTRGIMAHFNNEAEFIGVLGHEIGHVTARHSAAQLSKQQLLGAAFVAGMIVSPEFRQFGDLAQQGLGLLFLKFGRDDESQSDELGVDYSTQIGYDAHEMANFFSVLNRMQEQSGQSIPTFLSTHPHPADRFNRVHQLSEAYQAKDPGTEYKVGRDYYLKMIDGIVYGEDPRQGYVEYNTFFHPELKFHFPVPPNWQLVNTPQMVQMASKDGKALILLTLSSQKSLQAAAQETIEQDQLSVVESSQTTVNGFPAIAMISTVSQNQQQGQPSTEPELRILTYLIQYEGLIYKFHGLARSTDFNNYYRTFTSTITGFKRLNDESKMNVQPDQIRVRRTSRDETLASALGRMDVNQEDMEPTAVLNNMQLTDQLPSGTLLKTIIRGRVRPGN